MSGSSDGTQALCARRGARVIETDWPGYGAQKNRAVATATHDWGSIVAYAVVRRARGPLAGRVVRYDHRAHAVHDIAAVPGDDDLRGLFQIEGPVLPQVVVVLVVDPVAVTAKYGARGGRFALAQVGHAAQNVSLRLAADGLSGYVLGGGLDREVLTLLGVAHTGVRYGMALACGR